MNLDMYSKPKWLANGEKQTVSKYDKEVTTKAGSEKMTNGGKLPSCQAYLTFFAKDAKPHEITEAYCGVAGKNIVDATRNGGRIPAILNNAEKLAAEGPTVAKGLEGSTQKTREGIIADVDRAIAALQAFKKEVGAVKPLPAPQPAKS